MNFEGIRQALYKTLMFSGIGGYEIAASLTSLTNTASTPTSVAVRLIVATLAFVAIIIDFGKAAHGSRRLVLGFCLFWYIYLLRITYATTISYEQLTFPAWYYYTWSIGVCALPMFGLSLWSPRLKDADSNFMMLFTGILLGSLLASFGASSVSGRLELTALNPILLGQLGTTLTVMTAWVLLNRHQRYRSTAKLIFFIAGIIGSGLLIGANSRGPIVSAAICLVFIAMTSNRRSRIYAITSLITAAIAFIPATQYIETEYGLSTYSRLFEQPQLTEENTLDRLERYSGALNAFMNNPLLGHSLEEPTIGGYPHNIFIEALMATGIIGGGLLLSLIAITLIFAIRITKEIKEYGWISVLFLQYLIAAQFSGAIYTTNYLWVTIGLVISINASLTSKQPTLIE